MEKYAQELEKECVAIKAEIDANTLVYVGYQAFIDEVDLFYPTLSQFININKKIEEETSGIVIDKNDIIEKMAKYNNVLSRKYRTYARKTSNNQLYKDVNATFGVLINLPEVDFLSKSKHLLDVYQAELPNMGAYKITQAKLDIFGGYITALEGKISLLDFKTEELSSAISHRGVLEEKLQLNIINFKDLIFEFEEDNHAFYKKMDDVLKLDHMPHGVISLIVHASDSVNDSNLVSVSVTITIDGKDVTRKTTALGNLYFKNLPMGRYTLKVERFDYAQQIIVVDIINDKPLRIKAKLVKI